MSLEVGIRNAFVTDDWLPCGKNQVVNVGQAELCHKHGKSNIPFEVFSDLTDMTTAKNLTKCSVSRAMLRLSS